MTDLHVSKKTVGKLFSEMQNKKFIIPDYQRPYKWNIEKCETLWNDIENFSQTEAIEGSDYFLGTIVSFINDNKNAEIIDGQQRITSFMLLLRAFYKKLEDMIDDREVNNLRNLVAPCIWNVHRLSGEITDKKDIHIFSEVATEEDNETFHRILETGVSITNASDNYSLNYNFFKNKCDEYATSNPLKWKELCLTILDNCVILPIECDTQDTALTIFSTLNDRGMPLADSDIFKAQIYKTYPEDKRKEFTEIWKELTLVCKQGNFSIDDLFRYYTHTLRARNLDKSKEVGLRKFYAENKYHRLKNENLIPEITCLAYFWRFINTSIEPDIDFSYILSTQSRIYLHCLNHYPNEYWRYITSVFFLKNKDNLDFEQEFEIFLKKLIAFLFAKFIEYPSVNAIKDDIYQSCISINLDNNLQFKYSFNEDLVKQQIDNHSSSRISRALLLLHAYLDSDQKSLIPATFDIEHIFPKKWQDTNYNGWNKSDADLFLDRFGNKVVLEKKLNIQAGNGYFGIKKLRYSSSSISTVLKLANYSTNDWLKEDIEQREEEFKETLINYFKENILSN